MGTTNAQFGFAIESTKNTRATPNKFVGFVQESMRDDRGGNLIVNEAMYAGRRLMSGTSLGTIPVGGSVSMNAQAETATQLWRLCVGGTVTTAGAGPYTHTLTPGALPSATFQLVKPSLDGTARAFDYTGCMVNQWTLSVQSGQFANHQVDVFAYDELTNQSVATATYDAAPTLFTFRHLEVTIAGETVCPDSMSITGNNNLSREYKSCANDAGRATINEAGMRSITGVISRDWAAPTRYTTEYKAGTLINIILELDAGASAKLNITGKGYLTGETPTVSGPNGQVKEGLGFTMMDPTSDATGFTLVVTNDEATP